MRPLIPALTSNQHSTIRKELTSVKGDKMDYFNFEVLSFHLLPVLVDTSRCGLNLLINHAKPGGEVKKIAHSLPLHNEPPSS